MLRTVLLSVGVGLGVASAALAQPPSSGATATRHPEEGRPFIRHYRPVDVGGGGQTWAILQDTRGVIYAATGGAVLEFDGATWRRVVVDSTSAVRSMALDASGRIYLGSATTFGYLEPDDKGKLRYVRLDTKLSEEARRFNDVWRTYVTGAGVYLQTERAIFRWANDKLTVIPAPSRFNRSSLVGDRLHLTTPEHGLRGDRR